MYLTTRIWKTTLQKLRLIAAIKSVSIVTLIDDLANQELVKMGKEDLIKEIDSAKNQT